MNEKATPPLDGIRVVDLSTVFAGPGVGMHLADQGADVIKVEPLEGDPSRGPGRGAKDSPVFFALNRNKRSLVADLRSEKGREVVRRLIATADVVVENFRPGILARMGFDYETHSPANPGLVWLSVTGYDPDGPFRERRGYDLLAQAIGGALSYRAWPSGQPMYGGIPIADVGTSIAAVYAVTLGLLKRTQTGRGQHVNANLLNIITALQAPGFFLSEEPQAEPAYRPRLVPWQAPYRCADDRYIMVALNVEREWLSLLKALDLEHIGSDPRYPWPPYESADELALVLDGMFETRTRDEWMEYLLAADIAVAPVNSLREAISDPMVRASHASIPIDDPRHGRYWVAGVTVHLDDNPPRSPMFPSPGFGQHSVEILRELGYRDDEITALGEQGAVVIASPAPQPS